jgi:hypothetical protein
MQATTRVDRLTAEIVEADRHLRAAERLLAHALVNGETYTLDEVADWVLVHIGRAREWIARAA